MKSSISLCAVALLIALGSLAAQQAPPSEFPLSAAAAGPQTPPQGERGPYQPQPPRPLSPAANRDAIAENMFPPELVMSHQKAIGLDDAQKTYIRGELLKTQTRFTELQWQLQDAMESLASLLKEERVDEQQALAQLDKVLNYEREIKRTQIGLLVRIKNKLTPEQQAQLRQLRGPLGPGLGPGPEGGPRQP